MLFTNVSSVSVKTSLLCILTALSACGQGSATLTSEQGPPLGASKPDNSVEAVAEIPTAFTDQALEVAGSLPYVAGTTSISEQVDLASSGDLTQDLDLVDSDSIEVVSNMEPSIKPITVVGEASKTPEIEVTNTSVIAGEAIATPDFTEENVSPAVLEEVDLVTEVSGPEVTSEPVALVPPSIGRVQVDNDRRTVAVTLDKGSNMAVVFDYHLGSKPHGGDASGLSNDLGDSTAAGGRSTYTFTNLPWGSYTVFGRVYYSYENFSEGTDSVITKGQYVEFTEQVDIAEPVQGKYITIGDQPGDATCLALGQTDVPFGSATIADWGRWIGYQPRFFIGNEFLAVEDDPRFGKVLRHKFVPNHKGTEWVAIGANIAGSRTYRIVQMVYLEEGWDWGGEVYQGGKMGFGFGSGTYPTGGKDDPKGFTARLGWRGSRDGNGKFIIYSYAADRTTEYGEDIPIGDDPAPIGQWVEILIEVTTNSSIDKSDGSLRVWLDGNLEVEEYNKGWQLAGNKPSIDSLFYMGMYGGHGWAWAPDDITYMKFGDVCWAQVIDGYSGIDPDAGITKVDPAERSSLLFDDYQPPMELEKIDVLKDRVIGKAGETSLLLNLTTQSGSLELTEVLNQSSSLLNDLIEGFSNVPRLGLPANPVGQLRSTNDGLGVAQEIAFQNFDVRGPDLVVYTDNLRSITVDVAAFGLEVVRVTSSLNDCDSENSFSETCMRINAQFDDIERLQTTLEQNRDADEETFFNLAQRVWDATLSITGL